MAKNQNRRMSDAAIKKDRDSFAALKKVQGYAPANTAYTVNKLQAAADGLTDAAEAEAQAESDLKAAIDAHTASQWNLHNLMLSAKDQVKAQFGNDSAEVQAVGLKRKSEYKQPRKRNGKQSPS